MAIDRVDPYRSFSFKLDYAGIIQAGFQECSGLDAQRASIDYREGNDPFHVRKLQGLNSFSPISLKRGITDSTELWDWYRTGERRNASILLLDEAGNTKLRWDIINAWPSKWIGPAFNSTGNSIAIESLELAHEEIVRP